MTDRQRRLLGLALAALAAAVVWWLGADGGSDRAPTGSGADPVSGLPWVEVADLPAEAADTLADIDAGGPYAYPGRDDETFGNFEGLLPDHDRGYYREYTVDTPGSRDRGARRIVTGSGGEFYWTSDHYQSFLRIRR